MRKIEREMIEAISKCKSYSKDNTQVTINDYWEVQVYLHGNRIAIIQNNKLLLSDKGYQTKTTKSRLNAILSHYNLPTIYSKNYQWFIGDEEWNGTKTFEIKQ